MSKEDQETELMKRDLREQLERARDKEILTTTIDIDSQDWAKKYPDRATATKRLFAGVSHAVQEREKTLRELE